MRFETQSGSMYEVNQDKMQVRRVSGMRAGTERVGNHGNWKAYREISNPIVVGQPVLIVWTDDVPLFGQYDNGDVVFPTTITSVVVAVETPRENEQKA